MPTRCVGSSGPGSQEIPRAPRQGGLFPTVCCYSPTDAKKIVAGCSDGSVQLFFDKADFLRGRMYGNAGYLAGLLKRYILPI